MKHDTATSRRSQQNPDLVKTADGRTYPLTPIHKATLVLRYQGASYQAIAEQLGISTATVRRFVEDYIRTFGKRAR